MKTSTITNRILFFFGLIAVFSTSLVAQDDCPYYFRTIDGGCNNFNYQDWGKAHTELARKMPSQYSAPDFQNTMAGGGRMNPRAISNYVCTQPGDVLSNFNLSSMVFTWGQFLDHDITETAASEHEVAPITIPHDDPLFRIPIDFKRSKIHEGSGASTPREYANEITHWIDGSNVYGSDDARASWLRTYEGGKLKTSHGNLLPYNTIDGEYDSPIDPNAPNMAGMDRIPKLFVAGDVRANEQPGLTALHTLFVREHNRICDEFISYGYYDDEMNYQIARSIVAAYIQAITYNEFLPALGIHLDPYVWYDEATNPNIMNEFAHAAYRFGHSMVSEHVLLADDDYFVNDAIPLSRAFFSNRIVQQNGIKPILLGLTTQQQQEPDVFIIDELRNFLFSEAPNAPGLDLAALNIQRGRDHGLPDYNTVRMQYLGRPATNWADITSDPVLQDKLKAAYGNNLNDVDLWIGLLAEDKIPGGSVGATMAAILKDQFQRLRDGDRFYYEIDPIILNWGEDIKNNVKLSTIIFRNTDAPIVPFDVFHTTDGQFLERDQVANKKKTLEATRNFSVVRDIKNLAYPNPTSGKFNVKLDNEDASDLDIQVFGTNGQVIKQVQRAQINPFHEEQFDLSELPSGIYSIRMKIGEVEKTERIILNK